MTRDQKKSTERVAIIGAGVAGVATAGALHDYGIDFTVFDRNHRPGGLWADNYPGAKGELVCCSELTFTMLCRIFCVCSLSPVIP